MNAVQAYLCRESDHKQAAARQKNLVNCISILWGGKPFYKDDGDSEDEDLEEY